MPTGDIINAVNDSSDIVYEYDAGGRLARQKDNISSEDTLYIYDNAGRLSIIQSGNREIVYKYGKNGELLSVRDNRQRLSVDFEYDKMTRETKRTFANGVSQKTAYDSAGRQIIISEYSPTGTYTGAVPPGYAFSRSMLNAAEVEYFLYKPQEGE